MNELAIETALREYVSRVVDSTPILDIHTHIYTPSFGGLLLWGIDELLTYHYLVAEVYRVAPMPYERFWAMSKNEQADYIWEQLFLNRSPISEACRGVLTVLNRLGLEPGKRDLPRLREHFASLDIRDYVNTVFDSANLRGVIMTNDPFDDVERPIWQQAGPDDDRFAAALRIDPLVNEYPSAVPTLRDWGYDVCGDLGARDVEQTKRFLHEWIATMKPRYMAVSLPPSFRVPEDSPRARVIERCILPVAREAGIPFAMMIGVKKLTNPSLQLAGDSVGRAEVSTVEYLCREYPDNRFLVTMLGRENQHELVVAARKFHNMHLFGCWWFMNNPVLINELTRMRLEMLGLSFTPQHSDARVLDQLIYKWTHSRAIIGKVLADKYVDMALAGWTPTEDDIRRDVADLFGGAFERFCDATPKLG